jgi:hypothetical protein
LKEVNGLTLQRKLFVGQPLLVALKGGEDAQLPDLPVNPVPLTRALQIAKHSAHARRVAQTTRGGGRMIVQKAAQRGAVLKARKAGVHPLRPEQGKRVKIIVTPRSAAPARKPVIRVNASRVKVATR